MASEDRPRVLSLPGGLEFPLDGEDDSPPPLEDFVKGSPRGEDRLGLVLKRTYAIRADGRCELADVDRQEFLFDTECVYDEVDPPLVSPVAFDNDGLAFRERTDLVVQGSAYAYDRPATTVRVGVRFGDWVREIVVHGDRVAEWGPGGSIRFGEPEPFREIPVRYDRAYGGVDVIALRAGVLPLYHEMCAADPDLGLDTGTPFHYPRNPAGTGFLIEADEERVAGLRVPNLEFPFDPITPERLAVGSADRWFRGPLPAAMDWQGAGWFPRVAYLGGAFPPGEPAPVLAEFERGWVAPDLLEIPRLMSRPGRPMRPEFTQAASAGMSFPEFAPDGLLELANLHPDEPMFRLRLPGEVPDVRVHLTPGMETKFTPHLNAVVVRPGSGELVMTWCAQIPVSRAFRADQAADMKRKVDWLRVRS